MDPGVENFLSYDYIRGIKSAIRRRFIASLPCVDVVWMRSRPVGQVLFVLDVFPQDWRVRKHRFLRVDDCRQFLIIHLH